MLSESGESWSCGKGAANQELQSWIRNADIIRRDEASHAEATRSWEKPFMGSAKGMAMNLGANGE